MVQIIYLKIDFEPNSDVTTKNTNMAKTYKKVALLMFYSYSSQILLVDEVVLHCESNPYSPSESDFSSLMEF